MILSHISSHSDLGLSVNGGDGGIGDLAGMAGVREKSQHVE